MTFTWMMASRLWTIRCKQSNLWRKHKNPWWITVIFDYIKLYLTMLMSWKLSHSRHLVACSVLRGSSQSVPGGTTSRRRIFPLITIGDIKPNGSKVIDDSGATSLGFLVGKSKLAPLKGHTIPRLELCGAVLATELGETICNHMSRWHRYRNDHTWNFKTTDIFQRFKPQSPFSCMFST
jgi:hypothetical protein